MAQTLIHKIADTEITTPNAAADQTWTRRANPHVAAPESDKAHDDQPPTGG